MRFTVNTHYTHNTGVFWLTAIRQNVAGDENEGGEMMKCVATRYKCCRAAHMDAALTDLNLMLPPQQPRSCAPPSFPGVRSLYNIPPVLTLISTVIYRRPGLRQIFGMAVQVAFQHGLRS